MLESFMRTFTLDASEKDSVSEDSLNNEDFQNLPLGDELNEFFHEFGGASYHRGAYRIISKSEIGACTERINSAFPEYRNRVIPFAIDWLNRMYCVDLERSDESGSLLLLFSHLSDEVLQIPAGLLAFHEDYLVNQGKAILDLSLFDQFWGCTEFCVNGVSFNSATSGHRTGW